ncbi:uncharacterized protein LOC144824513 [Lissotriton helveticus]
MGILPQWWTDHSLIHFQIIVSSQVNKQVCPATYRKGRDWSKLPKDKINSTFTNQTHFDPDGSVDQNYHVYCNHITETLDKLAPLKKIKSRRKLSAPWFSEELKLLRIQCRQAERKWRRLHLESDKRLLKTAQAKYKGAIAKTKALVYATTILQSPNSTKTLFNIIRDLSNPACMSNKVVCDEIAIFFEEKITKIVGGLSQGKASCQDTLLQMVEEELPAVSSMESFPPLTEELFNSLAHSISSGTPLDPLPHRIWKEHGPEIFPWMRLICCQSLEEGVVPEAWKQAVVTPLLKKPSLDPTIPAHFRPISLLPYPLKVLEKVVVGPCLVI